MGESFRGLCESGGTSILLLPTLLEDSNQRTAILAWLRVASLSVSMQIYDYFSSNATLSGTSFNNFSRLLFFLRCEPSKRLKIFTFALLFYDSLPLYSPRINQTNERMRNSLRCVELIRIRIFWGVGKFHNKTCIVTSQAFTTLSHQSGTRRHAMNNSSELNENAAEGGHSVQSIIALNNYLSICAPAT